MNSSGTPPASAIGEIGSGMKAFVLLVILFFTFMLIASSRLASVDLTPDTTTVSAGSAPIIVDSGIPADADIITIQSGPVVVQDSTVPQVPVTGATCTNPYIVQSGDMLSGIAEICNTSLAAIRTANPEIRNANLIYPGQSLRIPMTGVQLPTPLPVTGDQSAQGIQTSPQVFTTPDTATNLPGLLVPATGSLIQPGTGIQVTGLDFPPNTAVYIAIGPQNTGYTIVASGATDPDGRIVSNIIVPAAPDPNAPWVVVVATTDDPIIQAASVPFFIAPQ